MVEPPRSAPSERPRSAWNQVARTIRRPCVVSQFASSPFPLRGCRICKWLICGAPPAGLTSARAVQCPTFKAPESCDVLLSCQTQRVLGGSMAMGAIVLLAPSVPPSPEIKFNKRRSRRRSPRGARQGALRGAATAQEGHDCCLAGIKASWLLGSGLGKCIGFHGCRLR